MILNALYGLIFARLLNQLLLGLKTVKHFAISRKSVTFAVSKDKRNIIQQHLEPCRV